MSEPREPAPPVAPGDVLAGKYRVERVLGIGGMGVVVAAHHLHLDERVAIKFVLPEIADKGGEPVARFMREGRAAAKIRSEHVARVTDVGALDDGAPYLVMEYLEGKDLQKILEQDGPLPVDEALDYVLQASEALAEAHSIGIVHRDLKPANLFLARRADGSPCVKVLDFGISKMRDKGGLGGDMNTTRATLGSPLYMSPEQLVSTGDVDARADLWSLGVILYELLSGRLPYEADTLPQLVAQVLQTAPTPLRTLLPELPVELDAVVMRCLQPATARYQNIGELAAALAPFAPRRAHISIERIARLLGSASGLVEAEAPRPPRASRPDSVPDASPYAMTAHSSQTQPIGAPKALAQSGTLSVSSSAIAPTGSRPRALVFGAVALALAIVAAVVLVRSRGQSPVAASAAPSAAVAAPPPSAPEPVTLAPEPSPVEPPATASSPLPSARPATPALGAGSRPRAAPAQPKPGPTKTLIPDDRQ